MNRPAVTKSLFLSLLLSVTVLPLAATSFAQDGMLLAANQDTPGHVVVRGNQRVESQTVYSYLGVSEGGMATEAELNAALKRLFETGFFSDIRIAHEGDTLVVNVVENPIVNRVAFEGNEQIKDEDLEQEITLKARSVYTRTAVQNDVKRVLDIYRRSGRYDATVEPKVITLEQNRVNLVYEITEGPITKVQHINFIGNNVYSDDVLKDVVRTEEGRWYRFFSSDDKYDPDRLLYDQELLRRHYVSNGYADFQVKSAITELTPNKDGFYITFTVEEGDLYHFGEVKIDNRLEGVDTAPLEAVLKTKAGKEFDATAIETTIDEMVRILGDQGFAFVDISPDLDRHPETDVINLTYRIAEGPRVYVERININGNVRTLDEVVRREFRLAEGDAYNTSKLRRSEQRINNLGFFESVKIQEERGSAPDKVIINTDVAEQSTGELTFGVGYSTLDGALGDVGVRERNFMGRGQELRARFMLATQRQQVDFGFTEPYFMGRDIAAGIDVFRIQQDLRQESSFDRETTGFTLRANYALTERLRHTVNYTLRENTVSNIQPWASRFVRDQEGTILTSVVGHSLVYDSRDNRFDPTKGAYMRFSQEYAGLGGDSDFLRHEGRAEYYYSFAPKWTLMGMMQGGHVLGLGENVRIQDRFFIGSREIRGFNNAGVGPRDITTTDALGGNIYYSGTLEQRFPLGLPEEMGFSGAIFVDAASLWEVDDQGPEVVANDTMRLSTGFGIAWTSPFGPIRLDFAKTILKEEEDETEAIRFSFGSRF